MKSHFVLWVGFFVLFLNFFYLFLRFSFNVLRPLPLAQKIPWYLPDRENRGFVDIVAGSRLFVADGQKLTLFRLMNTFPLSTFSLACFCRLAGQMHHGVATSEEVIHFWRMTIACPSSSGFLVLHHCTGFTHNAASLCNDVLSSSLTAPTPPLVRCPERKRGGGQEDTEPEPESSTSVDSYSSADSVRAG